MVLEHVISALHELQNIQEFIYNKLSLCSLMYVQYMCSYYSFNEDCFLGFNVNVSTSQLFTVDKFC